MKLMEFVDVSLKFNCEDDCVTIPDIQNGVYTEKIKQILEELVGKYSIDNVTEMKTEVNLKIDELTQLYDKIHLFREFFETKLKLALFLDLTHGDDCSKIECKYRPN